MPATTAAVEPPYRRVKTPGSCATRVPPVHHASGLRRTLADQSAVIAVRRSSTHDDGARVQRVYRVEEARVDTVRHREDAFLPHPLGEEPRLVRRQRDEPVDPAQPAGAGQQLAQLGRRLVVRADEASTAVREVETALHALREMMRQSARSKNLETVCLPDTIDLRGPKGR